MRLKHKHFNRIKEIIQHEDNDLIHHKSIDTLVKNFISMFGAGKLSNSLKELQLKYLQTL